MDALKDINGKDSIKRLWANRYLWLGFAMPIIYILSTVISNFFGKQILFVFPYEIWYGVLGFGAAALGLTIFESKVK